MNYHVAKNGDDFHKGTASQPFLTIQKAATVAVAGDTITVHEGIYREWVSPVNGGTSVDNRIVYEGATGEKVVIKGSEVIKGWEQINDKVWKVIVPNALFGEFNPFARAVAGDWLVEPRETPVHLGEVYLNGEALYEAKTLEEVYQPVKRFHTVVERWWGIDEEVQEPEKTLYVWYARVECENTIIYANFQGYNPNEEYVEINVRKCCFFPKSTGINYITVRGFEMAQAATAWAPPTAEQVGIIGPNWSKGWIIENNIFHDAKCSAISLGKEKTTGDNNFSKWRKKPGYQYQMEAVFQAGNIGWSKERIGSHIVRNNIIYNCGQNGIVGHLGCIFSEIYGNEIYRVAIKREYYGHEIAGIKLHAAIDVHIHHNYIHDCLLGTWLDWQAQGTRVSSNIYDKNTRDFMIEVTHGPCLVDNNIFTAEYTFDNAAQGTAFVHNLCGGFHNHYDVRDRSTPYHLPHSTEVLGSVVVYGNDDRWYQNIFWGGMQENRQYGTAGYDGAPTSLEEYIERVKALGEGDVECFAQIRQPAYINANAYLDGARAFDGETEKYLAENADVKTNLQIVDKEDGVYLKITLPEMLFELNTRQMNSKLLGMTRITEARYENADGSDIILDYDMNGRKRSSKPTVGPLEDLEPGENEVLLWKR